MNLLQLSKSLGNVQKLNVELLYIGSIFLGLFMIYCWIHFIVIQFLKSWKERSVYEKFLTIFSIITFVFYLSGSIR